MLWIALPCPAPEALLYIDARANGTLKVICNIQTKYFILV
jgi:hypothetical protein